MSKVTTNVPQANSQDYNGRASHARQDKAAKEHQALVEGTIVRTIPGSYTVVCELPGKKEAPTLFLPAMMSGMYGASSYDLPHEGTQVLVYCPKNTMQRYVLAVLPVAETGLDLDTDVEDAGRLCSQEIDPEPGSDYVSLKAHKDVDEDEDTLDHIPTNGGRPWNVLAGEWARGNKMGVTMAVLHFFALMQAGDKAKLEMSVFDDLVRLTSGTFEHQSSLGINRIFDDEGELTQEMTGSSWAPHRFGEDDFKEILTEEDDATENSVAVNRPEVTPKDRFRMFSGALADLFQIYTRNAYQSDTDDRSGDFRASVDYDGHFNLASRSGISLSLKGKIPVPVRKKEPWDPEGDKAEDVEKQAKEEFEFDEEYPYGRNLQMREAMAWREKLLYQRFDEKKLDFKVPEHGEVQAPPDEYDAEGSKAEREQSKNCGVDFMPDGSIRFWDAWGSEIYMRGGNIILAAQGNVEEHVGKTKVVYAAQDVVIKARESMDLHATNKDVRVTSGGLMHMHSIGKGTLITTDSEGMTVDGDSEGESVSANGIVIGKAGSDVALVGDNVTLAADKDVRVRGDNVILSAASRFLAAAKNVFMEGGGRSALKLSASACSVIGGTVSMIAGSALSLLKGDQAPVIQWIDIQRTPYTEVLPSIKTAHGTYHAEAETWLEALDKEKRAKIRYTYRTPEQYGTTAPSEIDGGGSDFLFYVPSWQVGPLSTSGTWEEEEIEGTYPWPGKGTRDSCLVTYEEGDNVDAFGDLSNRSSMSKKGGSFSKKSMDEYGVNE